MPEAAQQNIPTPADLQKITPAEAVGGELTDRKEVLVHHEVNKNVKELGLNQPEQLPRSSPHVDAALQTNIGEHAKKVTEAEQREPESYKEKTPLSGLSNIGDLFNYADQVVTGRTHRITDVAHFSQHKEEMVEEKQAYRNTPKQPGFWERIGNWFLEEKKAA